MLLNADVYQIDLKDYLVRDMLLSDEIAARRRKQVIVGQETQGKRLDNDYEVMTNDDSSHSTVSVSAVIVSSLKIRIPNQCSCYCSHENHTRKSNTDQHLVPNSQEEEDIFAFDNEGWGWGGDYLPLNSPEHV